jgi:trehalose synthase
MQLDVIKERLNSVEDYEPFIGAQAVERILGKARRLSDLRVSHVNSTYYGGGVSELLSSLTLLMNAAGVRTGWRVIQGRPEFFSITKKLHNALQGADINLSDLKMQIHDEVVFENAVRFHLDHDIIFVHDPQPLPLIKYFRHRGPWIWQCHVDLTDPNPAVWAYLRQFIELYDAVVFSIPEYAQQLTRPQNFFMPAIDPFSVTNYEIDDSIIDRRLRHYAIPTDLPLIAQISRFDHWKDPHGVIEAFRIARKKVDCTLVLLGNVATDDPEGQAVFEELLDSQDERLLVLSCQDSCLVNALQRRAHVILQKSLREGFGLTVTEAMWKGTPVIGGNTGGIRHQIQDGVNGFLVSSVEEAADRLVTLLQDQGLRRSMGARARDSVRQRFLMSRLMEQYFDLMGGFETTFTLHAPGPPHG